MARTVALIMAGGGGTRLWPASTTDRPKQIIDPLLQNSGSLIEQTVERLEGLVEPSDTYVVAGVDHLTALQERLPALGPDQFIGEPTGQNTMPCIALSVVHLRRRLGPDADAATLVILPADHHVTDAGAFRRHLEVAAHHARTHDTFVTLGITITRPDTGFGYIRRAETPLSGPPGFDDIPAYQAAEFHEKPDAATARTYFEQRDNLYWNAGIFVVSLGRMAAALQEHCGPTWQALAPVDQALEQGEPGRIRAATAEAYPKVEALPIDVAVMEKIAAAGGMRIVPAVVGWSDIGNWKAVHELLSHDGAGNAVATAPGAAAHLEDCQDTLVWADGSARVIAVGTQELAVVVHGDRVLVCPLDRAQELKEFLVALRRSSGTP